MGKTATKNLLIFQDTLGFLKKTVFIKTTYFKDDSISVFLKFNVSRHGKRSNILIKMTLQNFLNNKITFISGKILLTKNYNGFALQILEEKKPGVPGVFCSEESSELRTGNLKITMEMFLSSVSDTFNFEFLKEREMILMKI